MDTEWSLATANSQGAASDTARVVVYESSNYNNANIMDVYTQMEADAHARTMSTSWGIGETQFYGDDPELDAYDSAMHSIDKIFSNMSGEGWTLVAASGDQGATGGCTNELLVQFPASDPNVVGAGGTELSEGNPYEAAWTGANYRANPNANPSTADACNSNQGGSTGGFSQYFRHLGFSQGWASPSVRFLICHWIRRMGTMFIWTDHGFIPAAPVLPHQCLWGSLRRRMLTC